MKLLPVEVSDAVKPDASALNLINYVMMCLQRKKITGIFVSNCTH